MLLYLPPILRFVRRNPAEMGTDLERFTLTPALVARLVASALLGLAAAVATLLAGWHPLLAIPAYSFGGSAALLVLSLAAYRRPAAARRPVVIAAVEAATA